MARQLNIEKTRGAVVTAVKPGSKAAKAGLQEGDVIVEVNRHEIDSAKDFKQRVLKHKKSDGLKLLVKQANGGLKVVALS